MNPPVIKGTKAIAKVCGVTTSTVRYRAKIDPKGPIKTEKLEKSTHKVMYYGVRKDLVLYFSKLRKEGKVNKIKYKNQGISYEKPKKRICLRCDKPFMSRGNRICSPCHEINAQFCEFDGHIHTDGMK